MGCPPHCVSVSSARPPGPHFLPPHHLARLLASYEHAVPSLPPTKSLPHMASCQPTQGPLLSQAGVSSGDPTRPGVLSPGGSPLPPLSPPRALSAHCDRAQASGLTALSPSFLMLESQLKAVSGRPALSTPFSPASWVFSLTVSSLDHSCVGSEGPASSQPEAQTPPGSLCTESREGGTPHVPAGGRGPQPPAVTARQESAMPHSVGTVPACPPLACGLGEAG